MDTSFHDLIASSPFIEFSIILVFAAIFGSFGQILKQPLIVMFIALGIVVGPAVFDIAKSKENIELLAEIGISVLLFIVGLKLDLRLIKSIGKIALLTGLGQVLFTSAIGYIIGLALGFTSLHSFYIAIALTFSSTIIIVKLLSDKKEIDALHGQIAIGFLIVQDIVVILAMIILSTIQRESDASILQDVLFTLGNSAILVLVTIALMKWVIPALTKYLAQSQELLTLFAIAFAVGLASISELIGFSGEVGAFLAGVTLASSPYKDVIGGRLISLRDFLLLFFFVHLGANLDLSTIGQQVTPALIFSLFVLIGNPIIVLIIMGRMRYRKRTGFLAGLTVAQISEFSLIFAGLGLAVGHIDENILGLITLVGLITIGASTYLILYSIPIYNKIAPLLSIFERNIPNFREDDIPEKKFVNYDILIIGLGRLGGNLAKLLEEQTDTRFLGVDFDPSEVSKWRDKTNDVHYGDVEDPDLWTHLPLNNVKCIINTITEFNHAESMMKALEKQSFSGNVFLTAGSLTMAKDMERLGAHKVLYPQQLAAVNFYNENLKPKD